MICRDTNIQRALRSRQRGFLLNPFRFGGGGGGPTDPNYANVSLLLHFDGTDGSTTFTDNSPSPKTPTVFGNAQIDTAVSKFGGASGLFDGAGDYLSYTSTDAFVLSSGDFTVEVQYRPNNTTTNQVLMLQGRPNASTGAELGWFFQYEGAEAGKPVRFAFFTGTSVVQLRTVNTISSGVFSHLAATREGTTYRLFIDGVLEQTLTTASVPNNPSSAVLQIGRYQVSPTLEANGWMDELRITKGVARYTANFTPPTAAFPDS
jgi:hypothetical protein